MYIKRVIIQGFKTYKNTTIVDAFSPQHNVVLGRNGSGKSNFFAAIRFVLSDAYTHMSREERQSLIHEGSGTVMSAYVEIIFDNTDRRFPIDRDEIVVRRTIGLKKDDYSLDHKSSTRSDIMNLLESAGFSKSNPYYIVPQGRITSLTNAKDSERLQLLKEVAGAKVFEFKLKESLKEMGNSNKRREKIDEMLQFIESRLDDLNLETHDLKNYEKLNNLKKMLEFNIFDKELSKLNEAIEEIDINHNNSIENTNYYIKDLTAREQAVRKLNEEIVKANSHKKVLEIEKSQTDTDTNELLSKIAAVKLKFAELQASLSQNVEAGVDQSTLQEIQQLIKERESELMSIEPVIEDLKLEESELNRELVNSKARQRMIVEKQGRFDQFTSKKERDAWLRKEVESLTKSVDIKKQEIAATEADEAEVERQLQSLEGEINSADDLLSSKLSRQSQLSQEFDDLKLRYNSLIDERKSLWREDSKLQSALTNYESELNTSRQRVNEVMDRSMAHGLESVKRIVKNLKLDGVYGPLGELINVSDKYKTAVEVIGASSLFHVVVDNDATASLIMDELIREKSGRVTFMPLNRIHPAEATFPETNDCVPLMKKISFEPFLSPIIRQVFGKAVVVMNLERGAEVARDFKLTSITLDGDRCDKKGVLSGGFRDFNRSRLDTLAELKKWKSECEELENKLLEIRAQLSVKDQEITKVNESLGAKRKEIEDLINEKEALRGSLQGFSISKNSLIEEISSYKKLIYSVQENIKLIENQRSEHESELLKPFKKSLSEEEQTELNELNSSIPKLEKELDSLTNNLLEQEFNLSRLRSELSDNYKPREAQLVKKLANPENSIVDNASLNAVETELYSLNEDLAELNEKSTHLQQQLEAVTKDLKSKEESLEKSNDKQRSILAKLESFTKSSEKNLNKKSILSSRRDQINKKIRELGVLPEEAFKNYKEETSDRLLVQLGKVNEDLKKYSHVNKKAMEQSITFTKQRDELVERRTELDEGKASIENLINVLEERKDNAIIDTFKQVSEGFTEIFEQLVPMGTGKLIIQRKDGSGEGPEADDEDMMDIDDDSVSEEHHSALDNYTGVSIQVSFTSKDDEQQRIEQLSGGQKTLCAIALILAIQKCDPAPFYLFDEIDAALDTQYRASVAKLINKLSKEGKQFICTTFRSEMLEVADKFYGVIFNNKVSSVTEINREDAIEFIEGQK